MLIGIARIDIYTRIWTHKGKRERGRSRGRERKRKEIVMNYYNKLKHTYM